MLSVTSYVYDWDDPVHGSTDGWDPARTYDGYLGKFTNETVTLTVDDWAPHTGLQLGGGMGLNAWGIGESEHEVVVYVGQEAVYRYFTYRLNPYVVIYDEEPLGDYATLGYIPHTDSQVQLRFEGSGFDQQDQYDYWKVMQYSIHAVMPVLQSLTISDNWSTASVATNDGTIPAFTASVDSNDDIYVHLSGLTLPDVPGAYDCVRYDIHNTENVSVASGVLGADGADELLPNDVYLVYAGVDVNGNGVLDTGERTRRVMLQPVFLEAQEQEEGCPHEVIVNEYMTETFTVDLYALNWARQRVAATTVTSQTYTLDAGEDATISQVIDSRGHTWTINGSTASLTLSGPSAAVSFEIAVEISYSTPGVRDITLAGTAQIGEATIAPMGSSSQSRVIGPGNPNAPVVTPTRIYHLNDSGAVKDNGHAALIVPNGNGCTYYSYGWGVVTVMNYNNIDEALAAAKAAGYDRVQSWKNITPQQAQAAAAAAWAFNGTNYNLANNNCWHMVSAALSAAGVNYHDPGAIPNKAYRDNVPLADESGPL